MRWFGSFFMAGLMTCCLMASASQAAILSHHELGEMDAGAVAGGAGNDPTTATVGTDLAKSGDPTYVAPGAGGAPGSTLAMDFDGDDFYHDAAAAPAFDPLSQDLTLSAWVKPSAVDGFNFVTSLGTSGNSGLGLLQTGGPTAATWQIIHMGQALSAAGPAVVLDTWTQLELKYTASNTTSELFVNGAATGVTIVGVPGVPSDLTIGANHLNATPTFEGFFKGAIDEVTVDVVPEPASIALCGLALIGLVGMRRRG